MLSSGDLAIERKPRFCLCGLYRVQSVGKTDVDGGVDAGCWHGCRMLEACEEGAEPTASAKAAAGCRASVSVKGCLKVNLAKIKEGSTSFWG